MSNREEAIQLLRELRKEVADLRQITLRCEEAMSLRMGKLERRLDRWLKDKAVKQQFRQVTEELPISVAKLPSVDPEEVKRWAEENS